MKTDTKKKRTKKKKKGRREYIKKNIQMGSNRIQGTFKWNNVIDHSPFDLQEWDYWCMQGENWLLMEAPILW